MLQFQPFRADFVDVVQGSALVSYNSGISACEKGEQWQGALALLREMREAKLEPNVSATALGSARAGRANSGSGRWHCPAKFGRGSWSPTSSVSALVSARARRPSSGSQLLRCSARCG
ncbi:unnamed protein product, partial [Prorocentrum cordatum]